MDAIFFHQFRRNEKGFLLLESLLALTLVTGLLAVYSPWVTQLMRQTDQAKERTVAMRVLLEQTRRLKEGYQLEMSFNEGTRSFQISETDTGEGKGIRILYGTKTEEIKLLHKPDR